MSPARRSVCIRGCIRQEGGGGCREARGIDSNPPSINDNRFVDCGWDACLRTVPRDGFCTVPCAESHLRCISTPKRERRQIKTLSGWRCHAPCRWQTRNLAQRRAVAGAHACSSIIFTTYRHDIDAALASAPSYSICYPSEQQHHAKNWCRSGLYAEASTGQSRRWLRAAYAEFLTPSRPLPRRPIVQVEP